MRLDGARSATRKEQEGVTCATCGTIDFQARDNFELRAGNFTSNFQSPFMYEVLKVGFKQKLVPRRRKIQVRSPVQSPLGGAARTLPLPMRNKRTLFSDALLPALYLKRTQPEIYGIMRVCFRWIVPFYRVRPINHRNFIGAIC